jgi:hypothetical protein
MQEKNHTFLLPIIIINYYECCCFWKGLIYEGNSISKLQIQVATYVFELSAGNCHR